MRETVSHRRIRSWWMLVTTCLATGSLGGCLGTIQREMDVLFATDATQNLLLLPYTIIYNMLGSLPYEFMTSF